MLIRGYGTGARDKGQMSPWVRPHSLLILVHLHPHLILSTQFCWLYRTASWFPIALTTKYYTKLHSYFPSLIFELYFYFSLSTTVIQSFSNLFITGPLQGPISQYKLLFCLLIAQLTSCSQHLTRSCSFLLYECNYNFLSYNVLSCIKQNVVDFFPHISYHIAQFIM